MEKKLRNQLCHWRIITKWLFYIIYFTSGIMRFKDVRSIYNSFYNSYTMI